ncbi:DoxX family protein [Hymenobacter daeguensis]
MTTKSRNILGWILTGLLGLMLLASAADKISGSAHALQMGGSFGLTPASYRTLGLLEAASVLLLLFPRTGVLGTLLLSSYLGGAIATHLQHQQGILFPMGIEALVWIAAVIRFPELLERLLGKRAASTAR